MAKKKKIKCLKQETVNPRKGPDWEKDWKEELIKENKKLEEWMIDNIGSRCEEYEKDCIICQKWKLFDKLKLKIE